MSSISPTPVVKPSILPSLIRTVLPLAWATLLAWGLQQWPFLGHLIDKVNALPVADAIRSVLGLLVAGVWYGAWRKAEPWLAGHARWAQRLLFGITASPIYQLAAPAILAADPQVVAAIQAKATQVAAAVIKKAPGV